LKVYLVRHARAVPRSDWAGEPLLRPLSERGWKEAEALAEHLANDPPLRIVAAPALRCQQTVELLASAAALEVEVDERLGEGESAARVLELLPTEGPGPVLFCSHADVITGLLQALELAEPERGARITCKKGSVWVIEGRGYGPSRATYFEPVRRARRGRAVRYAPRKIAEAPTLRAGVLDMGSTSFTLLIADVAGGGALRPVVREKVMLRLGAGIAAGGRIPEAVFERSVRVARELRAVAEQEKVQLFLPVATAAVREASNGRVLAAAISSALGQPIRILSGEEEARVIFGAFQRRLALGPEPVLGLDLGGGSLELAVGSASGIRAEVTLPLGAVRLHGELVRHDPMTPGEAEALRDRVRDALAPHVAQIRELEPVRAIATGGIVRALARLIVEKRTRKARPEGSVPVSGDALLELARELEVSSHAARLAMRGVRRRRADLLPTGAVVLTTLAAELGLDGYTICDWGLREGVLLDAVERGASDLAP